MGQHPILIICISLNTSRDICHGIRPRTALSALQIVAKRGFQMTSDDNIMAVLDHTGSAVKQWAIRWLLCFRLVAAQGHRFEIE